MVYSDALDYVNPGEPIDITDLMIALAGAFSDALEPMLHADIVQESFWTRFTNFLTSTELRIREAGLKQGGAPDAVLAGTRKLLAEATRQREPIG